MICPICTAPAILSSTGNGGELYVAEEYDDGDECYDPDIDLFHCVVDHEHVFYAALPGKDYGDR